MLVLSSWVDPSYLVGANTEDEVIRRGFQFSSTSQGIKLPVGSIHAVSNNNKADKARGSNKYLKT